MWPSLWSNPGMVNASTLGEAGGVFADPISLITAIGVAVTIIIGYSNFNWQRRAAARESLEQLDDLYIDRPYSKIKAILHSFPRWPIDKSVVKFQIYNPTEIAGVSGIHGSFLLIPRHVFNGYEVDSVEDGYLVKLDTADPVEIRRRIQNILQKISEFSNNRHEGIDWVDYENVQKYYDFDSEELLPIHEALLEFLPEEEGKDPGEIRTFLKEEGYPARFYKTLITDLKIMSQVEDNPDNRDSWVRQSE